MPTNRGMSLPLISASEAFPYCSLHTRVELILGPLGILPVISYRSTSVSPVIASLIVQKIMGWKPMLRDVEV